MITNETIMSYPPETNDFEVSIYSQLYNLQQRAGLYVKGPDTCKTIETRKLNRPR